jgi:peptidoglycan/xylan/chitin deacetylase (PgdA/CDA1 family)
MGRCLFIRDDDAWTLDKSFRFFFDLALERQLPVVYAVIPGKMDQGLIRFLRGAKAKTPQLLDIVQHGWMHTNHSKIQGKKYEFGLTRSKELQREDIQQGSKRMRLAFRDQFTPAFVPPYHGYDRNTLRVLSEENFKLFSAGIPRTGDKKPFMEIPAQVSFSQYNQGEKSIYKAKDVVAALARVLARKSLAGVLTHHSDFATSAARRELTICFDLIASMRNEGKWSVLLFSDLERKASL